ncbi:MAG: hypothetical protein HYY40_04945 [Bacteroidetes bacterium]|nr:hypothetical protein [Bacteroidota bacterium]
MKTSPIFNFFSIPAFIAIPVFLYGQSVQPGAQPDKKQEQKERMNVQKIAFITNSLQLTPEEAQKFWPVYNEYENNRENLQKSHRDGMQKLKKEPTQMTEKDYDAMVEAELSLRQRLLDLKKQYYQKFKTILPASKAVKLFEAEKTFRREAAERRQNKAGAMSPKPPQPPTPPGMPDDTDDDD